MPQQSKPSKKHHFVPQAQLRHFAHDADRRSIWVFDKGRNRAWISSILNAGSENDFNTVMLDGGKWNFEDLFQDVDARSARLLAEIIDRRSVGWIEGDDREALIDLFATQILRTRLARSTPRFVAEQIREIVRGMGYNADDNPSMAIPTDSALRLGTVRSFLGRERIAQSVERLIPVLFATDKKQHFLLSDDPVVITNAFPYGDVGLEAHGVIAFLPIAPDLAVALVCPTIVERYDSIDRIETNGDQRQQMERYRDGFRSGEPIEIEPAELKGWNRRQVARSARYLYAATDDFEFARQILDENPKLRKIESRVELGTMGSGPPRRASMPDGLWLVIHGRFDHCMIPISELDEMGEGLTARTTNVELLELVASDTGDIRATLYNDGQARRELSAATVEQFGEQDEGWFRVVHRESGLREMMRQLDVGSIKIVDSEE